MSVVTHPIALVAGVLGFVWWLTSYLRKCEANPCQLPLPPGPKGYPIIGNLFDMPTETPWIVYDHWSKIYGDMIYFKVLGQGFLVLGSLRRTSDLFERRSTNYSDRPRMPMLLELMGWTFNIGLLPYGLWWRRNRRSFHDFFHPNVVDRYKPIQLSSARYFLRSLLKSPDNFPHLIRQSFGKTIMKVIYGITVQDTDDPYVSNVEEALVGISEAGLPGRFLVDVIPAMKYIPDWFPGAEFKRKAKYWRDVNVLVSEKPFELVKKQVKEGTAMSSVAAIMIENLPDEGDPSRVEEEEIAKNACATAYAAGADTTVSSVHSLFMALCLYPEAQRKAQAELDAVLKGRLPEFNDRPSLPYINAMVKETMRWHNVLPTAVAHMATKADEYDGYYIPQGTIVLGNSWSILHDPEEYEDPFVYKPDRYLKDGEIDPTVRDPSAAVFGFGRRICAGRFFSDNSLFSTIAHVLTVFDVKPALDEDGNEIKIKPEFTSGLLSYPTPFTCRITPRSKAAEELICNSELTDSF